MIGIVYTSYAWNALEIKIFPRPTPICGGVNGMVIDKNFKVPNLLLTTNDDVSTCSCTSIGTTTITIGKGMIFKLVPPLMGLIDLVVTIGCPPRLGPKVDDDAPISMC